MIRKFIVALLFILPLVAAATGDIEASSLPLLGDRFVSSLDATPDSPEFTVLRAMDAATQGDFLAYLELVHPDYKMTETQIYDRKRYEWKRFTQQVSWYIGSESGVSGIYVARDIDEGPDFHRIFLRDMIHEGRMPTPVLLQRYGSGWLIVVNSL